MIKFEEIETWGDLLKVLQNASEEQLKQPVQSVKGHPVDEYVYPLLPVICIGTVDALELRYARSSRDNQKHGEELVLFCDGNPFGKDGAVAYEMDFENDFLNGNDKAIYSKDHSDAKDWTGPAQKLADASKVKGEGTLGTILKHRLKNLEE